MFTDMDPGSACLDGAEFASSLGGAIRLHVKRLELRHPANCIYENHRLRPFSPAVQGGPCPHGVVLLGVAERQHHVVVEDAQRLLAFEAEASDLIPPGFIPAPVLLQISRPGLQRGVDGTV